MDSIVDAALAAKLTMLFPPSDDSFLAFPLSGAAFTREELDLFRDGSGTVEQDKQRSHNKAQFARLLNQIPKDSVIYETSDRLLWGEYERVIDRAEVADSVLTAGEQKRLKKARDYLQETREVEGLGTTTVYSPQVVAYYQYKEASEDAERVYLDEKISVDSSDDPEAKRAWEQSREAQLDELRQRALADWRTLGFKDEVEEAQATVASLGGRSPEVLRQSLRSDFESCIEMDLAANDPNGVLSTFYSPSDIFDLNLPWETLRLTKDEIADLHSKAPERMRSSSAADLGNIEEITLEYADVTIMRPWYDPSWFDLRSWRLPPDDGQAVSDGQVPRAGRIPAVIGSMVVARRVRVVRRGSSSTDQDTPTATALDFAPLVRAQVLFQAAPGVGRVKVRPPRPADGPRRAGKPAASGANQHVVEAKQAGLTISRRSAHTTVRQDLREAAVGPFALGGTSLAAVSAPTRQVHIAAAPQRKGPSVRDHRTTVEGRTTTRVPARRGAEATAPPKAATEEVEEVDLDCIVVLAYRCRRTPEAPHPDPQLPWSGEEAQPDSENGETHTEPSYPLPSGHVFSKASSNRSHSGKGNTKDRESVRQLQRRLEELGHELGVDGYYGDETASVVRTFQKAKSLKADGIVGPQTWRALWTDD
jgi:hypothetical protein